MKKILTILYLSIAAALSAQTVNEVAFFTRPIMFNNGYVNKARTSANNYLGYNRTLYTFKSNSNISGGMYTGFTFANEPIHQRWPSVFYENKLRNNFTVGLNARYVFYASKNNKLNIYFSFLGEVIWADGEETYQNLSGEGFYIFEHDVAYNYLAPYETKTSPYSRRYFNFLAEMGASYRIYKNVGIAASALWNMHTNDFIGSAGVNYKF